MFGKKMRVALSIALTVLCMTVACACAGGSIEMTVQTPASGFGEPIVPQEVQGQPSVGDTQNKPDVNWTPDIIDKDEPYVEGTFDDSLQYDYSANALTFRTAYGSFTTEEGAGEHLDYTTAERNSLAINTGNTPFAYGTYTCDVKASATGDTALLFCVDSESNYFWETGVSYYLLLMSLDGNIYLGKIANNAWSVVSSASYSFNYVDFYRLKIVLKNGKIWCYINDTLLIEAKEKKPLTGTGFGFRSAGAGAVFANISVTSQYLI